MASLDPQLLRWAVSLSARDAEVLEVRGLRDGGSPWLIRLSGREGHRDVVVRHAAAGAQRVEIEALQLAAANGIPAPRLIAAGETAMLIEYVDGSGSTIPAQRPPRRLHALGAIAARIHRVPMPAGLPRRTRPIAGVDFAALRRAEPRVPLLTAAEQAVAAAPARSDGPPDNDGFVHGDLWQGNVLWDGENIVAVIDWDCAGCGPAGVDLGSLRCDAAMCFGIDAAGDILDGWEHEARRPADDVAYWDLVAALTTPPDIGWFAGAISGQGRPDLTKELLRQRRDAFVADALNRMHS